MELQEIIAILLILAAAGYLGRSIFRKRKAFSRQPGCDADCGCSTGSKKNNIAA